MSKSKLETLLLEHIRGADLPEPRREYRFAAYHVGMGPGIRKRLRAAGLKDWRLDFAWPCRKVAAEVQGGTWTGGRHTRGSGYEDDCRKINAAQDLGWRVYLFTGGMLNNNEAVPVLLAAMEES